MWKMRWYNKMTCIEHALENALIAIKSGTGYSGCQGRAPACAQLSGNPADALSGYSPI